MQGGAAAARAGVGAGVLDAIYAGELSRLDACARGHHSDEPAAPGRDFARSRKFHNAQRNPDVALVIGYVLPPWRPRCVMIRGTARALPDATRADGQPAGPSSGRIQPE